MTAFRTRVFVPFLTLLAVASFAGSASADQYVLSSGAKGGYYHGVASRVAMLLMQEHQQASYLTSAGSLDNLTLLADPQSSVNVALAQADAVRHFVDLHPAFSDRLVVLDDLGPECVALITSARPKKGISDAGDLKTGNFGQLILPSSGSGSAVTFDYMVRMDPAYRQTKVSYRDPIEGMLQMRMNGGEPIAAVMLVKRPRTLTPEFEIVVENQDEFRVAPIRAEHVKNGSLPDGSPVYTFEEVSTGVGRDRHVSYETMCTRALIVTSSSKLTEPMRRDLSRVLLKWSKLIAPGR
jgi:hypothetical protein